MQEKYYIVFDSEEGGVFVYPQDVLDQRQQESREEVFVRDEVFDTAFEARLYIEYMQLD